jgi:Flp pilus assembly pilin Flp
MTRRSAGTLASDTRGLETVEWAIVVGLLVLALVLIAVTLGPLLAQAYAGVRAELTGQPAVTTEPGR